MTLSPRISAPVVAAAMVWMAGCGSDSSPARGTPTHGISGAVTGAVLEGVTITATRDGATVATQTTSASGAFAFTGLADGTYVLTPTLGGYTFTPPSLTVNVNGADVTGEGFVSAATPSGPTFTQADLEGTWRVSVLSAGTSPGWARATISVDAGGNVTFAAYADSTGATTAPGGLLPVLLIDATGHVRDSAVPSSAKFSGDLGAKNKNVIAAAASSSGTSSIAVMTKHGTATFSTDHDILGFGNAGGGARRFVYDQLTAGNPDQEWEFAAEQVGQGASGTPGLPQYTSASGTTLLPYLAPVTNPARPTDRTLNMVVSADGVVTETRNATPGTAANFIVESGFMTDDKAMIHAVGTATDGRFALRIYQVMNVVPGDATTATEADLAGTYAFRKLSVGAGSSAASGTFSVDPSGAVTYATYADSSGSSALPAPFTLAVGTLDPLLSGTNTTAPGWYGILSDPSDATLHGKLAYDKDLLVFTRTDAAGSPGTYSLTFAVK